MKSIYFLLFSCFSIFVLNSSAFAEGHVQNESNLFYSNYWSFGFGIPVSYSFREAADGNKLKNSGIPAGILLYLKSPYNFGIGFEHYKIRLKGELHDSVALNKVVTTMIDLYRLPVDFPGFHDSRGIRDPWERVSFLEDALRKDIDCPQFIPHIQLHEFEALLLAAPDHFRVFYGEGYRDAIAHLEKLSSQCGSPEEIDDGAETAPSKRIIAEIPAYEHDKAHAGPVIAESIGLSLLRKRCPHFDEWVAKLESLG